MIFIAGASGFVGGHLVDFLIGLGIRVRCLVRSEKAAESLQRKGAQVVFGDITDPERLKNSVHPGDMVIHLVGIIEEKGKATFRSVHTEGTRNLVSEAVRSGASHIFYQSALGADKKSWSGYLSTKAEAEDIVRQGGLPYTIFRPSLIVGPWDGFTAKMLDTLKYSPVIPIPGEGRAKFQPVYIKDWLRCIQKVIESPASYQGTFDIGGPDHITYQQIVEYISASCGKKKPVFRIPMGFMQLTTSILERFLPSPPVTSDQLRLLEQDNVCDPETIKRHFGFTPMRYADALAEFMNM